MEMKSLDQKLKEYAFSDFYPFHMPGHKRSSLSLGEPALLDITEIEGFDDLHHETGVLLEAEQRAAALWGARRSFLLVNGSTCGILAGMSAAAEPGATALIAENCHKSVRHGAYLRNFQEILLPVEKAAFGIPGQVTAETVEQGFREHPESKMVVITSPTYEGILSDIRSIAEVVHRHGGVLLVDEAHGAHLGMHDFFPESAVKLGADIVVQSLHKTLPSLTQTAVLHLCSDRVREEGIVRFLDIFETSSPSYVLMASADRCVCLLTEKRDALFSDYAAALAEWYRCNRDFKNIKVLTEDSLAKREAFARDPGKLVLRTDIPDTDGKALMHCLRVIYHLELERAEGRVAIGMTSLCDSPEGFRRLTTALHELDEEPELIYRSLFEGEKRTPAPEVENSSDYEIYRGYSL